MKFPEKFFKPVNPRHPYTIVFVYPKKGNPFVLKGDGQAIGKWLAKFTLPAFLVETYWQNRRCRLKFQILNFPGAVFYHTHKRPLRFVLKYEDRPIKYFKEYPQRWLHELDKFAE